MTIIELVGEKYDTFGARVSHQEPPNYQLTSQFFGKRIISGAQNSNVHPNVNEKSQMLYGKDS